ncbi:MAG TPA: sulfotransferase family protein, partial [Allosphingosinicella sp.]|nr:sulfotransferase family protein [Allosphingosinicella sp.]
SFGLFIEPCQIEKVVVDFEGEMRAVCATLGIDWRPELADFAAHVGERGVATPRAAQLAEGLNAKSIGRWRNYAGEMAGILPILEPWVQRFGYA